MTPPTRSPERQAWVNMWRRCTDPRDVSYPHYGARGISVCDRWKQFDVFLADMGPRPARMSLDRIDNDRAYSPENCRWASRTTQQRNTTRNTPITLRGATRAFMEWCEEYNINPKTVRKRLQLGWSIEQAFCTPVRGV